MRAGQVVVVGEFAGCAAAGEGVRDLMRVLCVRLYVEIRSVVLEHIEPVEMMPVSLNLTRALRFALSTAVTVPV